MKREFLRGLGLEEETIVKILAEYGSNVEKYKDDIKAKDDELVKTKTSLKELEASTNNFKDDYENQIKELNEKLSSANDELSSIKAEKQNQIKNEKLDAVLKEANVKSIKIVKSLLGDLEFDGEKFKDIDDKLKALQEDEETKMLFDIQEDDDSKEDFPPMTPKVFQNTGVNHGSETNYDAWEQAQRHALGLDQE